VVESLTAPEPAGPAAHHPGTFSAQEASTVLGVSPLTQGGTGGAPDRAHEHGTTVIQAESGGTAPLETEGEAHASARKQGLFAVSGPCTSMYVAMLWALMHTQPVQHIRHQPTLCLSRSC
jgi:hypothetical protein